MKRRWWQYGDVSVEGQVEAFDREELAFTLDEQLLKEAEVVAFRGDLRLEGSDGRSPAVVVYPPSFHLGEQPVVLAPELDIGRHRGPNGMLCLDHAVFGSPEPMSGAEAVQRAERLWWLWENDREQLSEEEADAPDPWANYVQHTPASAVSFVDLTLEPDDRSGFIDIDVSSLAPFRGSVQALRVMKPRVVRRDATAHDLFAGGPELSGPWIRLDARPSVAADHEASDWIATNHRSMFGRALRATKGLRGAHPQLPVLLGFVYPDEGPGRGETHDAWLLILVRPDGRVELPRPVTISDDERWVRQPEMAELRKRRVAVVGVGALGSQISSLLARAGVGDFHLLDNDLYLPGNRIRHDLDLADVGYDKVYAQQQRIRRLNPWAKVAIDQVRLGTVAIAASNLSDLQRADDRLVAELGKADLIVNATANPNAASYISEIGANAGKPVIHVWVSAGAWGGRILIQRPGKSACSDCLGHWQAEDSDAPPDGIPKLSEEPNPDPIMERGCADATFTGPGFELAAAAAAAARACVQSLLDGKGYPALEFDLVTFDHRSEHAAAPTTAYTSLPPHPDCTTCRAH